MWRIISLKFILRQLSKFLLHVNRKDSDKPCLRGLSEPLLFTKINNEAFFHSMPLLYDKNDKTKITNGPQLLDDHGKTNIWSSTHESSLVRKHTITHIN